MSNLTKKINTFLNIYNSISEEKLSYQEFISILPKFVLVLKYISLDVVEMIDLTDTLIEFRNFRQLDKINEETLGLIEKITNNKFLNLEGTLYFSTLLRHMLLPSNINKCKKEHEEILHISTFETLLEIINKIFNNNDYLILQTYNFELSELVLQYKKSQELYKKKIHNEIILDTIISHLYAVFYFNYEKYNGNYCILDLIINNSIDDYQQFINYCYSEGISNNFSKVVLSNNDLQKEYKVSQKMLNYTFDSLNNERIKRK